MAHLGLSRICRQSQRHQEALQHLQAALALKVRDQGRQIVLRNWIDFLEEILRADITLRGLSDPEKALADSNGELSRLQKSRP